MCKIYNDVKINFFLCLMVIIEICRKKKFFLKFIDNLKLCIMFSNDVCFNINFV